MIIIIIIIFLTISIETMKILHMNILIMIATLMKMMATNRIIDERTVRKFEKPNYKF